MGQLVGYAHCAQVTINHTDDGAQTNYQMKLTVNKTTGTNSVGVLYLQNLALSWTGTVPNDLRFTKSDGTSQLDYWIESSDANTATVWIEFDAIPAHPDDGYFYAYWGKVGDTTTSNITNTFIFGDDFSDNFPGTKWTGSTNHGSISGGILTVTYDGAWDFFYSVISAGQATCRYRARINYTANKIGKWGLVVSDQSHFAMAFHNKPAWTAINSKDGVTESQITSNFSEGAYYIFDILVRGGVNSRYFQNNVERTGSPRTTNPPNSASLAAGFFPGDTTGSGTLALCDWVWIGNYTLNEPTWGTWGAQEDLPIPYFSTYPHILAH